MAKQLTYTPLNNIGLNGLNTQSNPSSLDISWLTKAENVVVRESGVISVRKGLRQLAQAASVKVGAIGELGSNVVVSVGDKIITADWSTSTTLSAPATSTTFSGATSDWMFVNFNDKLYAVQGGQDPLEYNGTSWTNIPDGSGNGYPSTLSATTFQPSCCMGYYGRLWVGGVTSNKASVFYSDLLQGDTWNGGSSGVLDLNKVWGSDEIVAIAPFYGKLVIFGKKNIALYNNPADPSDATTFGLDEVIRGVGCVARDTVQAIGDDLVFLSETGLRSLARTTELDKVPLSDLSVNVKDTLTRETAQASDAKGIYLEEEGVYLLSFVDKNSTYVFDMKHITANKAPRVTTWKFESDREPACFANTTSKGFLVGQKAGSVASYADYIDKDMTGSTTFTEHKYTSRFISVWLEMGEGVAASLLKKMRAMFNGGKDTSVNINMFKDFGLTAYKTVTLDLTPTSSGTPSLFGEAEFGVGEYAPVYGLKEYSIPLSGSAKHFKIGMDTEVNGNLVSLQDSTLLFKQGKIR